MEKTEPASQSKVDRVRAEGDLPISLFSLRCFALLVMTLFVGWIAAELSSLTRDWIISEGLGVNPSDIAVGPSVLKMFLVPILCTGLLVLLLGLLQSKFFISFELLSPRLERLFSSGKPNTEKAQSNLGLQQIVVVLAVIALAFLIRDFLGLLNAPRSAFLEVLQQLWQRLLLMLVGLTSLLAILAYFANRALYFRRHRMSRAELERELKSGV
jgi:flagellar biosynthesis protein FlhB